MNVFNSIAILAIALTMFSPQLLSVRDRSSGTLKHLISALLFINGILCVIVLLPLILILAIFYRTDCPD